MSLDNLKKRKEKLKSVCSLFCTFLKIRYFQLGFEKSERACEFLLPPEWIKEAEDEERVKISLTDEGFPLFLGAAEALVRRCLLTRNSEQP